MYHFNEQNGMTTLMLTAGNGHHECISVLIANGADVNIVSEVNIYVNISRCEYNFGLMYYSTNSSLMSGME
jgi:ankyrin repeat protein